MTKSKLGFLIPLLTVLIFTGCGVENSDSIDKKELTIYNLTPQSGTQSYIYYGETNHQALGSLKNIRVVDAIDIDKVLVSNNDTADIRYPVISTSFEYNISDGSYKNLQTDTLSYIAGKNPYKVSLKKDGSTPTQIANSLTTNISGTGRGGSFSYNKISYLGSKQYLVAKNSDGDKILITPDLNETNVPIDFGNRELLTLSYPSFGSKINGYIVAYDSDNNSSTTNKLQNCNLSMMCIDIIDINTAYKFIGDIGGTTNSILSIDSKFYSLNKTDNSIYELNITNKTFSRYYFNYDSIYFIENGNISRFNALTGEYIEISSDKNASRIRAFTDGMVIYSPRDSEMYAAKKDGSSKTPIQIAEVTKLKGQKYPYTMAIGDEYLYNLYSLDEKTGKMTFRACKLEDSGKIECLNDSFWAAITASKEGKINFKSTYQYTPYAYIRVDDTDNYGGGVLKAIDPKHPLQDGITLGNIATYNFQTFMNNSRYVDEMIDSNGSVVIYGKNDLDYRGDAFLVNLNKANSLVNLTNETAPLISEINGQSAHCHGRYCAVCHSFAGGKIYENRAGESSAKDYTIRFDFEDGSSSILAQIRKGKGENFNTPLENLVGKNFTAVVVDKNGTQVSKSVNYSHKGAEYFNCNFCHRKGDLKHDAPNVISIQPKETKDEQ